MDLLIRIAGGLLIGGGVIAGFFMEKAQALAGTAAPSGQEAVLAIASVVLMFAGAALALCGSALFEKPDRRR